MFVLLTWTDPNPLEEGFRIYRDTAPIVAGALPSPLVELPPNTTEYTDNTAEGETTYYYRISTYVGPAEKLSAEVTVTTGVDASVPKLALYADEVLGKLHNNLLLSGDAQSGTDVLTV